MKELRRLCLPCAGKLQDAGIRCERVKDSGGSTGACSACGKRRLCFTWEIEYEGRGTPSVSFTDSSPVGESRSEGELKMKGDRNDDQGF